MKSILYSACIGSLALALTAGAAQDKDKRAVRPKPQQRTANVHASRTATAARPASVMPATSRAHRNVSAAQNRQRAYTGSRTSSNAVVKQNSGLSAVRERNLARNERMRERNAQRNQEFRARRDVAANQAKRPASAPPATADVNRFRNTNEFRNGRSTSAPSATVVRNRNITVNRTQNAAFYRGHNARVTNNWRGDAFRGQRYTVFRNYNRQWHDRSWWRSHYNRIVFVNNGWYYWNAGYWFPAWGYAPSVSYVYDGPIYGYNGLSPDQVTVNVQQQLASAGYYDGPIDGQLGPMTREAIAAYQADNGLAVTSAIDEPTLATMGLV